jgi:uncharacterized RDD family membrane protein YckC
MSFGNADDPNPYQSPLTTSGDALQPTHLGPPLATRVNRLGAAIIDGLIGVAFTMPVMFLTGYFERAMQNDVAITETAMITIFGLVMFFVVHGYLLATRGQTVGKLLVKTRIVDYHSNQILPFGKLIALRYIPIWVISMIPYVSFLGLVNVLFIFGQDRRCVHDYIAGTKVIDVSIGD